MAKQFARPVRQTLADTGCTHLQQARPRRAGVQGAAWLRRDKAARNRPDQARPALCIALVSSCSLQDGASTMFMPEQSGMVTGQGLTGVEQAWSGHEHEQHDEHGGTAHRWAGTRRHQRRHTAPDLHITGMLRFAIIAQQQISRFVMDAAVQEPLPV